MVDFEEVDDSMETKIPPSQERLLDAEEIEKAAANLTRPTARMHLESLAKKLRKESEALKRVEASRGPQTDVSSSSSPVEEMKTDAQEPSAPPTVTPPKVVPAATPVVSNSVQYVPIDKFAFDAGGYNSAFVTLYIDLPGVGSIDRGNITCNFTEGSFDLVVKDLNGKSYRLFKDNLENDIDVEKSKKVVKADKILVKLGKKKTDYGSYDHWNALTSNKKKKTALKDNPASGIMDLMKEMYETGDDNMRKVIGETMMKQRSGELDSGIGKGMGGFDDADFDV
jgi:calcyclin binding protein